MDVDVLGRLDLGGEQERRPVDRVELEDVLGDDVQARRPVALGEVLAVARVGERRVVVEERVPPDVDHLLGVPRHRHPPGELRARQRDVLEPAPDERERLVAAKVGPHELGPLGVEALERLLKGAEAEEPVLLALPEQRDLVDRAGVVRAALGLGLEVGAARAVPALVEALVDVAVVVHPLDDLLHLRHVLGVGGADEEVVGPVDAPGQLAETRRVGVDQVPRGDPLRLGRQRHRLAVLVGAGEEEDVLAALAVVAREHVGGDRRVGVAEMRLGVHVVDRGGDVEAHGRLSLFGPTRAAG